jgi:thiamine biosynthesis protein ThiS
VITVNRQHTLEWRPELRVADVLATLRYTFPHIIVAINGKLVPHDAYAATSIPDGADVRVVHLTAGG